MKPIYLDYAATTPVDPRVAQAMQACLSMDGNFGNPASLHCYGKAALAAVDVARAQVAAMINIEPSTLVWTSGATESNNLAIKGAAHLYRAKGKHLITMKTEHKSVLDTCQHLEKEGYQVTYLTPERNGLVNIEQLEAAMRDDTILVSIMQVNNETGVMQDLHAIADITNKRGILLHVDAAQSIGKTFLDLQEIPIDLVSLSAHKVYGPKGIGALYLRKKPRVRVEPLLHGGGHEHGMRSGTLPIHQIVGMGKAYEIAREEMDGDTIRIKTMRDELVLQLQRIPNFKLNMDLNLCVPHILSIRFEGMLADPVLAQLPNVVASTASACQGKGTEGSYVLRALGLTDEQAKSSIRFSFGRFLSESNIEEVIKGFFNLFVK